MKDFPMTVGDNSANVLLDLATQKMYTPLSVCCNALFSEPEPDVITQIRLACETS